ncbi:PQQ-binding-like beta-propeller repeat protein [Streptomyces sp. NPDC056002]|uniref:outer membrane protein assembly factor BamB family protein n=1 Tax=Streptomyces sp. NPDC056002 TaxID=3345675 RepID=UPI0035DE3879
MTYGPPPSPFTQSQRTADERRQRRTRLWVSVIVVLVVVACAGGWLMWAGLPGGGNDDSAGASTTRKQASDEVRETVEDRPKDRSGHLAASLADDLKPGKTLNMPGTWATDKVLVKGMNSTLEGIRIGTDEEAWHYSLSGEICGTTRHVTVDGRTAVLFRNGKSKGLCNQLGFFDLDTGKKLWQVSIPTSKTAMGEDVPNVSMTQGVVAAAWSAGSAAYDMSGGKRLWERKRTSDCREGGYAGGRALVVRLDCTDRASGSYDPEYRVQKRAPRTGKTLWTYKVSSGIDLVYLVSAEPPVLAVTAGEDGLSDLISLDAKGKYRSTIRLEGGHYDLDCSTTGVETAVDKCGQVVVGRKQAFITGGEQTEGINRRSNWIVSFDLATGKSVEKFDSGADQMMYPMRMSGDQLLAFKESTDNFAPASVVSLNPATGVETPYYYFNVPPEAKFMDPKTDDIVFEKGRVFFASRELQADGQGGKPVRTWGAIGIESVAAAGPPK